ncbi:MAG: DVUA0089 family protein [Rubricoccaceae bacterium]|nr:DVUA0089 family protein [Rubricoccaceae bacterium]
MRTTLTTSLAMLFACALLVSPAVAQDSDPDGVTAATDAYGVNPISGALETTDDVDCFAIYISDAAAFSASTNNAVSVPDTKLYLFEGDVSGATNGIAMNDDDPVGGTLLSTLPVGDPLYAGLSAGKYVLCVTSYDNDPLNAAAADIFPNCGFAGVCPPSGGGALASWDFPGFGDSGPYQIDLTGVGDNPGGCDLKFVSGPDIELLLDPNRVRVTGSVRNNGSANVRTTLFLDYNRAGGPPSGTITVGTGSLPPNINVAFDRTYSAASAPPGDYNVTLRLVDKDTGTVCATYAEVITISAPRVAGESGAPFEATAPVDFSTAVSAAASAPAAVAPNPFARQTTISSEVAAAADVRLAVYDVLGREVAVLVDARMDAGMHRAQFDAGDLAAGTYVYRLQVGNDVRTGRMTLSY